MGVLAWLGVPAAATVLAILWVQWASRARGPIEVNESLAERERFIAAFEPTQPAPARRPAAQQAPYVSVQQAERRAS